MKVDTYYRMIRFLKINPIELIKKPVSYSETFSLAKASKITDSSINPHKLLSTLINS